MKYLRGVKAQRDFVVSTLKRIQDKWCVEPVSGHTKPWLLLFSFIIIHEAGKNNKGFGKV